MSATGVPGPPCDVILVFLSLPLAAVYERFFHNLGVRHRPSCGKFHHPLYDEDSYAADCGDSNDH